VKVEFPYFPDAFFYVWVILPSVFFGLTRTAGALKAHKLIGNFIPAFQYYYG